MQAMQKDARPSLSRGLWPDGMTDLAPMNSVGSLLAEGIAADSPEAEQPHADLSHFLPPALVVSNSRPRRRPPNDDKRLLREVREDVLGDAEAAPASQYLLDPSHRVPEVERDSFERFLESHARDARIGLYVLVLGPDEKLSSNVDLSRMAQGSLLQRDSCLAVLPLGEPWRLRLFMSRGVQEKLSVDELSQILDDAIGNSLQETASLEQLHRLLVRLSIRLFWLESSLSSQPAETVARALPVAAAALPEIMEMPASEVRWNLKPLLSWLGFIGFAVLGFHVWRRWQRYRSRHYEWILPEPGHITPRFGCPHGATAAMVDYR
jgi:hypothetical protein